MVDDGSSCQSCVGSTQGRGNLGMLNGEAADVQFVDDALVPGSAGRAVGAPGKRRIDDHGLEHAGSVVATIHGEISVLAANAVTEVRVAPFQVAYDLLGVGIEQKFVRVEAMSLVWVVGAMDAVAVEKSGASLGQVAVPNLVGLLLDAHAMQFAAAGLIEQAEFDRFGVFGE